MDFHVGSQGERSIPMLKCCCGSNDCVFLRDSERVLDGIERDLRHAARVGQALLVRHEAYIADSENDRKSLTTTIEQLEREKRDLEIQNAEKVEENRQLLDQLEFLNSVITESDSQVQSLTATLRETQQELQRLSILAARTESLEQEIAAFERDQAILEDTLAAVREDEKSAVQRWREAERTIAVLHKQVERIEREAREERERHVEVAGRLERRRAVEKELQTAAGRSKGAAAARTVGQDKNGSNVVSHFVKDILQDNAHLQMGIVELRELLMNSNEEVERLRDQLLLHQPLDQPPGSIAKPTLLRELSVDSPISKELHVHHHYHAPPQAAENSGKSKTVLHRRPRKKRTLISAGHFVPPGNQTPPNSTPKPAVQTYAAAILSQTSVTVPPQQRPSHRWSVQSNQTGISVVSSVPSTPYADSHRTSSIFDRVFSDSGMDSSRPTTPDSNDPTSPLWGPVTNPPVTISECSTSATPGAETNDSPITARGRRGISDTYEYPVHDGLSLDYSTIREEDEFSEQQSSVTMDSSTFSHDTFMPSRAIRRCASHESLLSISGMDIHTMPFRPPRLLSSDAFFSTSSSLSSIPS